MSRRTVSRNKQTIYYQMFLGKDEKINADGTRSGQYEENYGEMTPLRVHISWGTFTAVSSGNRTYFTPYGIDNNYSISLYLDNDMGFSPTTLIWVGEQKFIVSSVRNSLNGTVVSAKAMK